MEALSVEEAYGNTRNFSDLYVPENGALGWGQEKSGVKWSWCFVWRDRGRPVYWENGILGCGFVEDRRRSRCMEARTSTVQLATVSRSIF